MIWALVIATLAISFGLLIWRGGIPRAGYDLLGAALLLGLAGYAVQGQPGYIGSPTDPIETDKTAAEAMVTKQQGMAVRFGDGQNWLTLADALSRNGQYGSAAQVLRRAVREHPRNADLWVALGNALTGHSDGMISPAAQFAFQKAADIMPSHPGPPFFMGLSLAQSGRLEEARILWQKLLDNTPQEASYRADLEARIARLDAMLAANAPIDVSPKAAALDAQP